MSAQDTARIDDAVIKTWNAHDTDGFLALCADDIVWRDVGNPEPLKGKEGARQFFQAWITAFPDISLRQVNRVVDDDQVAVELEFSGTNQGPIQGPPGTPAISPTGKKVTGNKGVYFARVRDGKIVEVHTYPDMAGMLIQLGLMPAPAHAGM